MIEIEDQASEWLNIINKAIESSRYNEQSERGPIVDSVHAPRESDHRG